MAKFNPCCCPVQKGLKAIGILQICKSGLTALAGILILIVLINLSDHEHHLNEEEIKAITHEAVYGTVIVSILLSIWELILGIILVRGAAQRSHAKCRLWLIATAIGAIVYFILFVVELSMDGTASVSSIILYILGLGFDIYCVIVVFAFLDELTSDPSAVGYNA